MMAPRRRILIVEDSRVQAVRVMRLLEDAGYVVGLSAPRTDGPGWIRRGPSAPI